MMAVRSLAEAITVRIASRIPMAKFTFHRIGNEIDSGWMALIDSDEALEAHCRHMGQRVARNWVDVKDSSPNKDGHCRTTEAGVYKTLLTLEMVRRGVETMPMLDCIEFMTEVALKATIDSYHREGAVYVNPKGGCRPTIKLLSCERILAVHESDDYVFPTTKESDFEIKRWPRGRHWYILQCGETVEVDGLLKWSTYERAEEALKSHKIKVRLRERN